MNLSSFKSMIEQQFPGSPEGAFIVGEFSNLQNKVAIMKRYGKNQNAINDEIQAAKKKISDTVNAMMERKKTALQNKEHQNKAAYENIQERDINQPFKLQKLQIKLDAMTKQELQGELEKYITGKSELWEPTQLELFAGYVKKNLDPGMFEHLKNHMNKNLYDQPWRRLMPPGEQKQLHALNNRGISDAILEKVMPDGSTELASISVDSIQLD